MQTSKRVPINADPPSVKPGKENLLYLTKEEHALIKEHYALLKATEQALMANKERQETIKAKITNFQLSQKIMNDDMERVTKQQLALENQITQQGNDYESGIKMDIKKRLKIPPDKGFSFDPATLEVTIGG